MAAITTGLHPKALWPGVKAWFGRAYDEWPAQYTDLVAIETSDKKYEEEVESTGFGMATIKPEGNSLNYDSDSQGYTKRFTHVTYAIGYMVTEEELSDNLYEEVSRRRSPDLAFALRQTKENVAANIFNRAFSTSYLGGDGVEFMATNHPTLNGNQQNELTTPADLSEAAIEDMVILIRQATNARGLKIRLQPRSLHVPTDLEFEAHRILDSILQNDTAQNAVNVLKSTGAIPEGIKVNQYFTSTTAWFIKTNARRGARMYQRWKVRMKKDNDFDTSNAKVKAYERYSVGWADWRGYYGTPGVT